MGGALSRLRSAVSTSESREVDVRPLLFLASEVDQRFASEILKMAMDGDTEGLDGLRRNAGLVGKGVAAAAAAVSDLGNQRKGLLHLASAVGDESICNILVSVGSHSVTAEIQGVTPLMAAIQGNGSARIVKLLLDNGARSELSKCDHNGNAPLHIAMEKGRSEIVELLLLNGAPVHLSCETGEVPLQIAARKGSCRMMQLLLRHNADINSARPTALSITASKGLKACVDFLLEAGADANISDENGMLPIESAAVGGWAECVEKLFPKTNPILSYRDWTVESILQHANAEEFWDAVSEFKTVTIGWRSWLDNLSIASRKSKELENNDKTKGVIAFLQADFDKIATFLGPLTIMILFYSYGGDKGSPGQILKISDSYFNVMCAGTMVSIPTLGLLYGFSAYFKDVTKPDPMGLCVCTMLLLVANCYLVFVMGVAILGNERASKMVVLIPGGLMILFMILLWPYFLQQPKFLVDWAKTLNTKRLEKQKRQRSRVDRQLQVVVDQP